MIVSSQRNKALVVSIMLGVGAFSCPGQLEVSIEDGSTANHLAFRIHSGAWWAREQRLGALLVGPCWPSNEAEARTWLLSPSAYRSRPMTADRTASELERVVYGRVPRGYYEDIRARPLRPGCYYLSYGAREALYFKVANDLTISEISPEDALMPLADVSLSGLIDSLLATRGEFTRRADQSWRFSGSDRMFRSLVLRKDSAVAALIRCLDRTDSATATVNERRVLAGAICAQALMRVAIVDDQKDGSGDWPGSVPPSAQPAQLRAAKVAWQGIVAKGAYSIR